MKQKRSFVTGSLLLFIILVCIFISFQCKKRCKVCNDFKLSEYKILYPNSDPEKKCDYVILRKKKEKDSPFSWIDAGKSPNQVLTKITPDEARQYVQLYNEKFNKDLSKTAFVDLDRREMMLYLIDVMDWIGQNPNDRSNVLRIYLGDRGDAAKTSITTVVTTASDKGETYLENSKLAPLDWGSLCPPPNNCIKDRKANLLQKAIELSTIIVKPGPKLIDSISVNKNTK